MPRLLREPLILFLLAGLAIFAGARFRSDERTNTRIEITPRDVASLSAQWQSQMGRAATPQEMDGLIDQHVREEIYYREARRLKLDEDDVIIRRRLAQKLTFLTEDLATAIPPSREELQAFYTEHADTYTEPQRFTFSHRYFSSDRREDARADAAAAAREDGAVGDPFMLQRSYAERSERQLSDLFGVEFAAALAALPVGEWQGPVRSAYGWHAVKVVERLPAEQLPLTVVADRVAADWQQEQRRLANEEFYAALRARYEVEGP